MVIRVKNKIIMTRKKKTITPEDPKLFDEFWDKYAMKLDRIAAVRAWNNLDKDSRRAAIDGIQHYREICETLGVRRMWPQGYLNHRRWEDEADTDPAPSPAPTGVGSGYRTDRRDNCRTISAHDGAAAPLPSRGGAGVGSDTPPDNLPDMAIW